MAADNNTSHLLAACARLTRDPGRKTRHGFLFRVEVKSRDGEECAVTLFVTGHRDRPARANLNDLADRLHVAHAEIGDVLDSWTPERLQEHLRKCTAEELNTPQRRR